MTLSSITSTHAVPRSAGLPPDSRGPTRGHSPTVQSKSLQRAIVIGAAVTAVAVLGLGALVAMRTAASS